MLGEALLDDLPVGEVLVLGRGCKVDPLERQVAVDRVEDDCTCRACPSKHYRQPLSALLGEWAELTLAKLLDLCQAQVGEAVEPADELLSRFTHRVCVFAYACISIESRRTGFAYLGYLDDDNHSTPILFRRVPSRTGL